MNPTTKMACDHIVARHDPCEWRLPTGWEDSGHRHVHLWMRLFPWYSNCIIYMYIYIYVYIYNIIKHTYIKGIKCPHVYVYIYIIYIIKITWSIMMYQYDIASLILTARPWNKIIMFILSEKVTAGPSIQPNKHCRMAVPTQLCIGRKKKVVYDGLCLYMFVQCGAPTRQLSWWT
jgi:hypothetical protein